MYKMNRLNKHPTPVNQKVLSCAAEKSEVGNSSMKRVFEKFALIGFTV